MIAVPLCFCALVFASEAQSIWIDVPFVQQSREGCGAASIAMVLQYWAAKMGTPAGQNADADYILKQLHSPQAHGIYASSMLNYFEQQGFRALPFAGTWSDLNEHLSKGRPLIAALQPGRNERVLHYVVVSGIDTVNNLVMFNDPAGRKLSKLDRRTFENEWKATGYWTLLAIPKSSAQ